MKCPVCENTISKKWVFCPQCGINLREIDKREGYSIDHIRALWTERGGEQFIKNFKAVEVLSTAPFKKIRPVRPILGDYVNVHISNLKTYSTVSTQPKVLEELCETYRLLGYFTADLAYKSVKLSRIVDLISRTEFYWKLLSLIETQKMLSDGWEKNHQAIIKIVKVDEKKHEVVYEISEGQVSYLEKDKPINFTELNILAGNLEATCNRRFIGEEIIESGKTYFKYNVVPHKAPQEYKRFKITAEESDEIVDTIVDYIVHNKPSGRKLKDNMHISGEQSDTYFMLKTSEGHRILEKYAGVKAGKKIAEKAKIQGEDEALRYIQKVFKQERIGLIEATNITPEEITLKLTESAYSSGVNNINMKLDQFPAGIIEGILKQATNKNWIAEETKCQSNGDPHCEITCRRVS